MALHSNIPKDVNDIKKQSSQMAPLRVSFYHSSQPTSNEVAWHEWIRHSEYGGGCECGGDCPCEGNCGGDCEGNCEGDCEGNCEGDCKGDCEGDCDDSCESCQGPRETPGRRFAGGGFHSHGGRDHGGDGGDDGDWGDCGCLGGHGYDSRPMGGGRTLAGGRPPGDCGGGGEGEGDRKGGCKGDCEGEGDCGDGGSDDEYDEDRDGGPGYEVVPTTGRRQLVRRSNLHRRIKLEHRRCNRIERHT